MSDPLPQDILDAGRADLAREPFWDDAPPEQMRGSITRPVGPRRPNVDRTTGEIVPWPARTKGPLPRDWQRKVAPDTNVVTSLDELDVWAAEMDVQVERYAAARRAWGRAKHTHELAQAKARRIARSSPTERGRRTTADIDAEVVEATQADWLLLLDAESELEIAKTLMFAAKDQMERLRTAVSAAKTFDPRGA